MRILLAIACVCIGLIGVELGIGLEDLPLNRLALANHRIIVTALGEKSPDSSGSQVELVLLRIGGREVSFSQLIKEGYWEQRESGLSASSRSQLRWEGRTEGTVEVVFLRQPAGGKAILEVDGIQQVVDLYAARDREISLKHALETPLQNRIWAMVVTGVSLGALLLLLFIFGDRIVANLGIAQQLLLVLLRGDRFVIAFLTKQRLYIVVSMVAILFPLLLILNIDAHFNIDWYHNLWIIGYFGEYFFQHHTIPLVINTYTFSNINMPFFYGYLFFPSMGLISSILGPNITLRLAIVFVYSVQFLAIHTLIKKLTKNVWLGIEIACLSIWAIFPLTNLYNRSAIAEFFAVSLLFTSVCIWFLSTICPDAKGKFLLRVLFAFCFSFSIGTHPITGFYGSIYIMILMLLSFVSSINKRHFRSEFFSLAMILVTILLIIFPWLYVTAIFSDQLFISQFNSQQLLFFQGIDQTLVRFSPFPLDLRSIKSGIVDVPSPYLDAQINIPLMIYLIFQIAFIIWYRQKSNLFLLIIKNEKSLLTLLLFSLFSFFFFLNVSLSPSFANIFRWFLWQAQFAYRFVTYQNLSLLLGIITIFMLFRKLDVRISFHPIMKYLVICCLILSAQSVLIKLVHANSVKGQLIGINNEGDGFLKGYGINRQDKDNLINLPNTFSSSILGYSTSSSGMGQEPDTSLPKLDMNFIVQTGNRFSKLGLIDIQVYEPTMIGVNIVPFPWSYIFVNGKLIDRKDTFLINDRTYFLLSPGNHKITTEIIPDFIWNMSRYVSFFTIISCGIYLIFNVRKIKKAITDANVEPNTLLNVAIE